MMNQTATRATWKNEPIDLPKRISISLKVNDQHFLILKKGLIPHEMEDKWFIFYENDWLYFHLSWTGQGIFKAQIIKEQHGYSIEEFWAERNNEKYGNTDDNHDRETICLLIANGLLKVDVREIYANNNIKSEADALKGWSNFGSMLFYPPSDDEIQARINFTLRIKSALFGLAIGDALGVPAEFISRDYFHENPVTDMNGFGTHDMPAGTFSDDSSLSFCLAEALTQEFDLNKIAQNFVKWRTENYWTARGILFDIGNATRLAIDRLINGVQPDLAGGMKDNSNGNGSLMRILPLLFHLVDKNRDVRFELTNQVSSITHRHIRSVIACHYYLEFALQIVGGKDKFEIYKNLQREISEDIINYTHKQSEAVHFDRLLKENIYELAEDKIQTSGYVIDTLEASIWCLLTTDNYKDAVLKAVNLGDDTDTTAAVTGGLAGLLYGLDEIPSKWIEQLARRSDIDELAERMAVNYWVF